MKRLYVTHELAELAMAWFLGSTTGLLVWLLLFESPGMPTYLRFFFWQVVLAGAGMTWVFLFTMSGSSKRREAAEGKS